MVYSISQNFILVLFLAQISGYHARFICAWTRFNSWRKLHWSRGIQNNHLNYSGNLWLSIPQLTATGRIALFMWSTKYKQNRWVCLSRLGMFRKSFVSLQQKIQKSGGHITRRFIAETKSHRGTQITRHIWYHHRFH